MSISSYIYNKLAGNISVNIYSLVLPQGINPQNGYVLYNNKNTPLNTKTNRRTIDKQMITFNIVSPDIITCENIASEIYDILSIIEEETYDGSIIQNIILEGEDTGIIEDVSNNENYVTQIVQEYSLNIK